MTELVKNITLQNAIGERDALEADRAAREAERAEIAALRAQLNGKTHAVAEAVADAEAEAALEPAWPYETGDFQGITLQYRQPSDSAMLALGMVTAGGSASTSEGDAQRQVKIINLLLQRHLSVESFDDVQARMCDPENPVTFEDLITFMRSEKE